MIERLVQTSRGATRCLEAGAGWPVLFIHAFPLSADMWRPQLERVPQGWRFIAPDTSGFGASRAATPARSMDDYAADVEAVLDAYELESAAICGLSMGGYTAFALYRRAPDRLTGLVLADTKAEADTPEGRKARLEMSQLVKAKGASAVADSMLPKLLGPAASQDTALVAGIRRMIESNTPEGIDDAIQAMMARPDSTADLPRLSIPVLVIVGEEDKLTPPVHSETMHRGTARSQLVVLPGAGHLSNLEAPDAFATAVANFLTSPM